MRRLLVLALSTTAMTACTAILGLRDEYTVADGGTDGSPLDAALLYVQTGMSGAQSTKQIIVTLPAPPHIGDLVVVAVGWIDQATVSAVVDSVSDASYAAVTPGAASIGTVYQQMFYLVPNAAMSNQLTITLDNVVSFLDVRVAEYAGRTTLDMHPLPYAAGGQFPSVSVAAPSNELLVAAGMANRIFLDEADGGFSVRILTAAPYENILVDRVADAASAVYTASCTLEAGGNAVFQIATFK